MLVLLVMSATLTMVMSSEHSLEGLLSNRGVSGAKAVTDAEDVENE